MASSIDFRYGNYTGPGWTGSQAISDTDPDQRGNFDKPGTDPTDAAARAHDWAYANAADALKDGYADLAASIKAKADLDLISACKARMAEIDAGINVSSDEGTRNEERSVAGKVVAAFSFVSFAQLTDIFNKLPAVDPALMARYNTGVPSPDVNFGASNYGSEDPLGDFITDQLAAQQQRETLEALQQANANRPDYTSAISASIDSNTDGSVKHLTLGYPNGLSVTTTTTTTTSTLEDGTTATTTTATTTATTPDGVQHEVVTDETGRPKVGQDGVPQVGPAIDGTGYRDEGNNHTPADNNPDYSNEGHNSTGTGGTDTAGGGDYSHEGNNHSEPTGGGDSSSPILIDLGMV